MSEQQSYRIADTSDGNDGDQNRSRVIVAGNAEDTSRPHFTAAGNGGDERHDGPIGQAAETHRGDARAREEMVEVAGEGVSRTREALAENFRRMTAAFFDMNPLAAFSQDGDAGRRNGGMAAAENFDGVLQSGLTLMMPGSRQALQAWTRFGARTVERNSRALGDLMQCRSLPDVLLVQGGLLTSSFLDWLQTSMPVPPGGDAGH